MGCKACERRRKKLQALRDKQAAKGRKVQAAAIGAVLTVSEAAGKAIHGEVDDEPEHEASGEESEPGDRGQ